MTSLTVGNPAIFALESHINVRYESLSQRALGFFVIHVNSLSFGIRSPEATLLACSFDSVQRRTNHRGQHVASFGPDADAMQLANAVIDSTYYEQNKNHKFFDISANEFVNTLAKNELLWAPDGDEAFDDGSHVLHFDVGDMVRLIAFKNPINFQHGISTLTEVWLKSVDFYNILNEWMHKFELEWKSDFSN
jgi:Immunity protein 42